MKQKLYTTGMIGKKHKVNLKKVEDWRLKLSHKSLVYCGHPATLNIPLDNHGRHGVPELFVNDFPDLPSEETLKKELSENWIKTQLTTFLRGGQAHMFFSDAIKDFPEAHINTFAPNIPYTFWHLLEHMRITQRDILDFCKNPDYKYMKWPKDYWPEKNKMATIEDWEQTIKLWNKDLKNFINLINNHESDIFKIIPWAKEKQNLLNEALLIIDHNAYHIGEFAILRQIVNAWPKNR